MTPDNSARLGWVILYVADPGEAIAFYERAFGMTRRMAVDSYAELDTGTTTLAFASDELAAGNLPDGFQRPDPSGRPFNVELALVFDDVEAAFERAVAEGCSALAEPARKPHGQTVGYVRDPFGNLIEIASPLDAPG
jgi:predicted enzyme related to lactoylglutathione lyase